MFLFTVNMFNLYTFKVYIDDEKCTEYMYGD